ncbi:response regulator transcription factor [Paludibacterium yongneupense]|uniref:response regulator transcription factor n=1 Tax=Paludibacterium yongneupense TaxID=400061 RepID=UPI0004227331|nr:response regulator transcription factor [Paludibacterium yongneupense]
MNRIALVEDTERLADLISKALLKAGIAVDVYPDASSARHGIRSADYAVAVVDRGLPDGDGLDLIRHLRTKGSALPCLILTARDAVHDRVDGLESGADDYLSKPFVMEELVARIRALMRRPPRVLPNSPDYKGLHIVPDQGRMYQGEEAVTLAPAEMQIMLCLVRAAGAMVRHATLEHAAWGMTDAVTPNALDVALHRLRKKLAAIDSPLRIVNVNRRGYALDETQVD